MLKSQILELVSIPAAANPRASADAQRRHRSI
jgi:hypothetical protein